MSRRAGPGQSPIGGTASKSAQSTATDRAPIHWYRPPIERGISPGPTLLWLHGGGFFRGSPRQAEAHEVAEALTSYGMTVATVGYRLAPLPGLGWMKTRRGRPRARFPSSLDDVLAAYRDVSSQSPEGVIMGGASAGACLAAAATLGAMNEGRAPIGSVFTYGFFHAHHPQVKDAWQRSQGHRRVTHARWALNLANRNYAGTRLALMDRLAFPGGHDLAQFPRTLVINAERDNMRASGDAFAAELLAAGVDVQHHVLRGTRHAFLNRPRLREFAGAVALIAEWSLAEGRHLQRSISRE